jgi:heat shock protein HslJ
LAIDGRKLVIRACFKTVLLGLVLAGCNAQGVTDSTGTRIGGQPASLEPGGLAGTAWRLESLGGAAVLEGAAATLEFPEAERVAGRASCNRFMGSVAISGDSLRFGRLASTLMACEDAVMKQEGAYLQALEGAERFLRDGATLSIYSKGLEKPLRFVRT